MNSAGAAARSPGFPARFPDGHRTPRDTSFSPILTRRSSDVAYGSISHKRTPRHFIERRAQTNGATTRSPLKPQPMDTTTQEPSQGSAAVRVGLYGLLNTIILIPLMISFTQIIFRDQAFQPYMDMFVKLVLVSASVHQLCFAFRSSLPFAVGQVQDAGLIFLSAMASNIADAVRAKAQTYSIEELIATTLFTLAGSTALLGIALIITGKLKLAGFVQYLPMPVIGGYLAYIGLYCLDAGLSAMSSKTIKDLSDWPELANAESLTLIAPGLLAGVLIFVIVTHVDHIGVLPSCLGSVLFIFYAILFGFGYSMQDARDSGWVGQLPHSQPSVFDSYQFYQLDKVDFSFMTAQIPNWIAMFFVVSFSSSLDVAAVEMGLGRPLDYNVELQTVGFSNLVSGLTGGFTGSYIFSQTIFTMRGGVFTRLNGVLVALLEIVVVFCPFSIIAYVPKFFFGALQTLIAADLISEWMYHARKKMLGREYAIVWLTFLAMNFLNLEAGIILGIVIAGFNFIYSYINVSSVRRVVKSSRVERSGREQRVLERLRLAIVTLEFDGFIFFGSSVKMNEEIRKHVLVNANHSDGGVMQEHTPLLSPEIPISVAGTTDAEDELTTLEDGGAAFSSLETDPMDESAEIMTAKRTQFFILDFERVRGVDATAVRSCFQATKQLLDQHGITLIFASVIPEVENLLRVHDVLEHEDGSGDGSLVFESVDRALEWCEDELLLSEGVQPLTSSIPKGSDRMQLLEEMLPKREHADGALTREIGEKYIEYMWKQEGDTVYRVGSLVTGIYFIGYGKVDVYVPSKVHQAMGPGFSGRKRVMRVSCGGICGSSEFALRRRHQFSAEARATTLLFFLSRSKYRKMQRDHPSVAARFESAIMANLARSIVEFNVVDV